MSPVILADKLSITHNGGGQVLIRLHDDFGQVVAVACLRGGKLDEVAERLRFATEEARGIRRGAAIAGRG